MNSLTRSAFFLAFLTVCAYASAQSNTSPWPATGNVGIGTSSPGGSKLKVYDPLSNPSQTETLNVDQVYGITATDTDYIKALDIEKYWYNIPSGVTANGYQVGLASQVFVSDPSFQGTIDRQWAIWTRTGIYNAGASGPRTVNTAIGLYLEGLANAGTILNHYGIYQEGPGTKNYFAGKVGIGTTSPAHPLDVNGVIAIGGQAMLSANSSDITVGDLISGDGTRNLLLRAGDREQMRITTSGNVGIGTTAPQGKLHVSSSFSRFDVESAGRIDITTPAGNPGLVFFTGADRSQNRFDIADYGTYFGLGFNADTGGWGTSLTVKQGGNVGIGTTSPTHKLSVNGTIKAKEVIVETTGWSDYVFADDYRLAPLSEVEAHIKAERRLPGIPSEQQVAEQGVSIGEMQAALLAKVEELTLHVIRIEKENAELKGRVRALESTPWSTR